VGGERERSSCVVSSHCISKRRGKKTVSLSIGIARSKEKKEKRKSLTSPLSDKKREGIGLTQPLNSKEKENKRIEDAINVNRNIMPKEKERKHHSVSSGEGKKPNRERSHVQRRTKGAAPSREEERKGKIRETQPCSWGKGKRERKSTTSPPKRDGGRKKRAFLFCHRPKGKKKKKKSQEPTTRVKKKEGNSTLSHEEQERPYSTLLDEDKRRRGALIESGGGGEKKFGGEGGEQLRFIFLCGREKGKSRIIWFDCLCRKRKNRGAVVDYP